jgi:hypothetical protein
MIKGGGSRSGSQRHAGEVPGNIGISVGNFG